MRSGQPHPLHIGFKRCECAFFRLRPVHGFVQRIRDDSLFSFSGIMEINNLPGINTAASFDSLSLSVFTLPGRTFR
jgi:hypothetical protein